MSGRKNMLPRPAAVHLHTPILTALQRAVRRHRTRHAGIWGVSVWKKVRPREYPSLGLVLSPICAHQHVYYAGRSVFTLSCSTIELPAHMKSDDVEGRTGDAPVSENSWLLAADLVFDDECSRLE